MDTRFYLLVDDQRNFMNMDVTARTYRQGITSLRKDPVTHLHIDHDLGGKKNGYDLLSWARDNDKMPEHVYIVTANPVARGRMEALMETDMGYVKARDGWWNKPWEI